MSTPTPSLAPRRPKRTLPAALSPAQTRTTTNPPRPPTTQASRPPPPPPPRPTPSTSPQQRCWSRRSRPSRRSRTYSNSEPPSPPSPPRPQPRRNPTTPTTARNTAVEYTRAGTNAPNGAWARREISTVAAQHTKKRVRGRRTRCRPRWPLPRHRSGCATCARRVAHVHHRCHRGRPTRPCPLLCC